MSPPAMKCAEVERFVHPYVDGEFDDVERANFERHVAECAGCRELVAFQAAFKSNLRARLRRPAPPSDLRGKIVSALDAADAAGDGPVTPLWRRVAPMGAIAAVAAAMLIFFALRASSSHADDGPIVEEAISAHEKNLPVEVVGAADIPGWMQGKVRVPVRPPRFRGPTVQVQVIGARLGHMRNRDAAQIIYRVNGSRQLTVYVFDPQGLQLQGEQARTVGNRRVYYGQRRGYNVIYFAEHGVGYAFASDLGTDEMFQLVSASLD
jgi:anti-sigma factor (TIGR02949 family)